MKIEKRKKILKYTSVIGVVIFFVCLGFFLYQGNRVVSKEHVTLEYAFEPSADPSTYFELGFLKKHNKVDVSQVDSDQIGSYPVFLEGTDQKVMVEIKDTRKPTIKLKKQIFEVEEGETLHAKDIIEEIDDLSGIQSVIFENSTIPEDEIVLDEKHIPNIKTTYKKEGTYENTIIVTDNNNNVAKKSFRVNVSIDYLSHVKGIKDLTIEEYSVANWLENISYDDRIKTVFYDDTKVENKQGKYDLDYIIITEKNVSIKKTVTVTVVKKTGTDITILDEETACKYIKEYLEETGAYVPKYVEYDHFDQYGFVIHGYDVKNRLTFTSFWYTVSEKGKIYDSILGEYIKE